MKLMHFGVAFVVACLGVLVTASPLQSAPHNRAITVDIPDPVLNGIFKTEPDFFDRGREQFEQEIEYLIQGVFDARLPVLTVDESVQFSPEVLEMFEGQPNSFDTSLTLEYL